MSDAAGQGKTPGRKRSAELRADWRPAARPTGEYGKSRGRQLAEGLPGALEARPPLAPRVVVAPGTRTIVVVPTHWLLILSGVCPVFLDGKAQHEVAPKARAETFSPVLTRSPE